MISFSLIRYIAIVSVAIYFIFNYFDEKNIKDEREELIRLKTYEFMHRLVMTAITIIAAGFIFYPEMHAIYPVMLIVVCAMYGEIFGKWFYRRKF